jgi:hypothetical protein
MCQIHFFSRRFGWNLLSLLRGFLRSIRVSLASFFFREEFKLICGYLQHLDVLKLTLKTFPKQIDTQQAIERGSFRIGSYFTFHQLIILTFAIRVQERKPQSDRLIIYP